MEHSPSITGEPSARRRRSKSSRTKWSCFACRSAKTRCEGQLPQPCERCVEKGCQCIYPQEDRRTTRFRTGVSSSVGTDRQDEIRSAISLSPIRTSRDDAELLRSIGLSGERSLVAPSYEGAQVSTGHSALPSIPPNNSVEHAGTSMPIDNAAASAIDVFGDNLPFSPFTNHLLSSVPQEWREMPNQATDLQVGWPSAEPSSWEQFLGLPLQSSSTSASQLHWYSDSDIQAINARSQHGPKVIRVRWTRPHGPTAFAAGLLPVEFDVTVLPSHGQDGDIGGNIPCDRCLLFNMPSHTVLLGLLDTFDISLGAQFPCVNIRELKAEVVRGEGHSFLIYCVCGIAARFSQDPAVALPHLSPHQYGDPFNDRARAMIGSVMAVPVRETVVGFVLLAYGINGKGGGNDLWMIAGLATRLALDMGLHLVKPANPEFSEQSQDCLVFWSVFWLDFIVSFGIGRSMTIHPESITQRLPARSDLGNDPSVDSYITLCRFIGCMAALTDTLNNNREPSTLSEEISRNKGRLISLHAGLPREILWTSANLRAQQRSRQAPNYVSLHLWYHTVMLALENGASDNGSATTSAPSAKAQDHAETIADITSACGVLDPEPYISLPFICQPWFSAGVTLMRVIESDIGSRAELTPSDIHSRQGAKLAELQAAFTNLENYWIGTSIISSVLNQRIQGIHQIGFLRRIETPGMSVDMACWALPHKYR